jgi:hypothetical protein
MDRPRSPRPRLRPLLAIVGLLVLLLIPTATVSASTTGAAPRPAVSYDEVVRAAYLPAAETFSFVFDGVVYSGPGGSSVRITGLSSGTQTITNISAGPAPAGWEYFGRAEPGSPILLPQEPEVNLSFSLINLTAAAGMIHFHENHIPFGTLWELEVNGSTLTSATVYINVSSKPGVIPVQALSTVDPRGTTRYTAPAADPEMAVVPNGSYTINFTVLYEVQVYASPGGTVTPNGSTWATPGSQLTIRATGEPEFAFGTWTGSGPGSYSGVEPRRTLAVPGPIIETATFWPIGVDREVIRVDQVGIPSGVVWTVFVDGAGYSSPTSALVVPNVFPCGTGTLGMYNLSVPTIYTNSTDPALQERFLPGPYPASVCGGATLNLTFSEQSEVAFRAASGGTVTASDPGGPIAAGGWVDPGTPVTFVAVPSAGNDFVGWFSNGSANVNSTAAQLTVNVSTPVEEVAEFAPIAATVVPVYSVTFTSGEPLPPGAAWSVELNGSSYASSLPSLTVPGLAAGMYEVQPGTVLSVDGLTELQPVVTNFELSVPSTLSVGVNFTTWYRVQVTVGVGGTADADRTWAPAGGSVNLSATASGGERFVGWAGSGNGSYTGTASRVLLVIDGPIQESAAFVPSGVSTHSWTGLILGAAAGVVVGAVAAFVLLRRGRSVHPPPSPPLPPPEENGQP